MADFNQYGWQQPQYGNYGNYGNYGQPSFNTPRINTNIIRVTSLEEAIMKTTERGSDMMYVHQDKNILYHVKVDFDGKKSWGEFPIQVPNQPDNSPATRADLEALIARVEALEKQTIKEVPEDGK
jgi:hypothetical protein